MNTKRQVLGRVVLCQGCCCGQVERGRPPVPVERLKEIWKQEKLGQSIQLTISGCLGPCDVPNVVLLMTAEGNEWLGGVAGDAAYGQIIQWARHCHAAEMSLPLPELLAENRLHRFSIEEAAL